MEMFEQPMSYWVGMEIPDASAAELADFDRFYSEVHAYEVMAANPGFVRFHRYELLAPDPRGDLGPRYLAMYELSEAAGAAYLECEFGPAEGKPRYSSGPPAWERRQIHWRMMWRQRAAYGEGSSPADALYVVGMDPGPGDASEFDAFYTSVHLPEIVRIGGYRRGTRLALEQGLAHPDGPSPSFVALYEAGPELAGEIRAGRVTPTHPDPTRPLSVGPAAWESRRTAWRLVYERTGGGSV
jgi:hypothetical protein